MFLGIFEVVKFFVEVDFSLLLLFIGLTYLQFKYMDKPLKEGFKVGGLKPYRLHLFFST